ncbi:hypothetical protein EYF80_004936 [Liparis tanakae]|uniref:Uncharacterized protein n=1 Tax=Liparis tanakae TaxID=230148 RepID=A0A4Z2J4L7_9TELE|nr:hypothetical protein EYF80_004936 [Liparis tanakae]
MTPDPVSMIGLLHYRRVSFAGVTVSGESPGLFSSTNTPARSGLSGAELMREEMSLVHVALYTAAGEVADTERTLEVTVLKAAGSEGESEEEEKKKGDVAEWIGWELMPKTLEGQITMEKTPSYFECVATEAWV